ncbi:MAG: hypothetical protein ACPG5B_14945 [Chitinophagales bacterium]
MINNKKNYFETKKKITYLEAKEKILNQNVREELRKAEAELATIKEKLEENSHSELVKGKCNDFLAYLTKLKKELNTNPDTNANQNLLRPYDPNDTIKDVFHDLASLLKIDTLRTDIFTPKPLHAKGETIQLIKLEISNLEKELTRLYSSGNFLDLEDAIEKFSKNLIEKL